MFKRLLLAAVLALGLTPAQAQNPTCPTRPVGDNSNACASTAFVNGALTNLLITTPFTINSQTASTGITAFGVNQDWSGASPSNIIAGFTSYGDASRFTIRRANGSQAIPAQTIAGNVLGNINFRGYTDSTSFSAGAVAALSAIGQDSFTLAAQGTNLIFAVVPVGSITGYNLLAMTGTGVQISGPSVTGLTGLFQSDSLLTINANTASSTVTPAVGTYLHLVGADSQEGALTFDAFGNRADFYGRRANGSNGSKTAVTTDDQILTLIPQGWDTALFVTAAQVRFAAAEPWSATNHGSYISFRTVPTGGSSTNSEVVRIQPSGGLSVGTANAATDPGNNVVLSSGLQSKPLTFSTLPTCNAGAEGQRAYITDQATAVSYRGATSGSGATRQAVLCSNSAWIQD